MDSEVDDTLLPTGFTEIWLPLPRTQQAMQLLRTFFTEPASAQESYARTGLYGWELYAAQPTDFWMSASHTNGEDEWKDGVFRIDPYWFGANPGDPTRSFYPPLWELLRDNGVPFRLHWGKYQPPYVRGDLRLGRLPALALPPLGRLPRAAPAARPGRHLPDQLLARALRPSRAPRASTRRTLSVRIRRPASCPPGGP